MKRLLYLQTRDEASDSSKQEAAEAKIPDAGDRLAVTHGSMRDEVSFVHPDPAAISGVMHAASIIRFNVDSENANDSNIAGTHEAVAFVRCYPDLLTVGDLRALVGGRMGQVAGA